tara:strand:+ start:337 stop:714 length:378 start_codon:yes stop_codon:yes gene_type:complete
MKFQVAVHIEANAGSGRVKYLAFDERYRLTGVKVVDDGGVAADNTNYIILNVFGNNGSTSAFQWSSQTSAQGALTDGVSASLVDQKSGLDVYNAGTSIKISKTEAGSGKNVDSMLILSFEPARKF